MKNFIQKGNNITLTAPYNVTSGDGLLVGSAFGVATGDALLEPVYNLAKQPFSRRIREIINRF